MVHGLIIGSPDSCRILLRSCNIRVSVEHIENGVRGMGKRRNAHPRGHLSGEWVIALQFVVQLGQAVRIGTEDNVVAAGTGDLACIGDCGEAWVSCVEHEWEVGLVRVLDLRVINDNCALGAIPARPALRCRGRNGNDGGRSERDRGRSQLCRIPLTCRSDDHRQRCGDVPRGGIQAGRTDASHTRRTDRPVNCRMAGVCYIGDQLLRLTVCQHRTWRSHADRYGRHQRNRCSRGS